MARKYIKNCTGDDCGSEKVSSRFSVVMSKGIFYVLLVGFVSVSVYVLFFSPYLHVLNIEISGTQQLDANQLKQEVEGMIQGKYLGIIPKNNFMLVSQGSIENVLTGKFKKIRKVAVKKKFPDSVAINVDERRALLVWCSGEKCYLIDENGTAYSEADFNSPELVQNNLLRISDTSNREVFMGENILDQPYEKYVLEVGYSLGDTGFETTGEYATPSRMAGEIRVKTRQGTELYFSTQFPLKVAITNLEMILKKEIPEEKRGEIEYFDLRNENKVFYKFKNSNPENVEGDNPENK